MDINQSSLSKFKANTSGTSGSTSEAKSSSESARLKEVSASNIQVIKQLDLKEGQIVKGQIIDHRYNEVRIQIEPGRQTVTARLAGDIPITIGQNANFQVTEGGSDHLVLKYMPNTSAAPVDTTVLKALAASNLAVTVLNKSIVSELLNNRMPIDKQTLQTLMKAAYTNRGASPLTLVLMLKNNIPMTNENIKQFEAYQNGTNKLVNDISQVTKNLSELLQKPEGGQLSNNTNPAEVQNTLSTVQGQSIQKDTANTVNFQADIPSSLLSTPQQNQNQAIEINGKLIDILYNKLNQSPEGMSGNTLSSFLTNEELSGLGNAVLQKLSDGTPLPANLPSDIVQQLQGGTLSEEYTMNLVNFLASQEDTAATSIIDKLINQLVPLQDSQPVIAEVLNSSERTSLLEYMDSFPGSSDFKGQVEEGTASLQKVLKYIQNSLTQTSGEAVAKFLQAPEYSKLLEGAFLKKWTLTPDKISKKEPVMDLYQNLQEDIEKLSQLTKSSKEASELLRIDEPLKNMKENLSFIKDLNEVFTYLPLPVQLKEQSLHSDLYVLTRKKALQEKSDNISVLLHLDMNNLGPLNIYIQMQGKQLKSKFYLEDKDTVKLIEKNIPLLEAALQKKGYTLQAELEATYAKPDFSKDFIEQSSPDTMVKRYTFDIRT